ncbi:rubrerythrin family protein [Methanocella arvoryzae]|uniref:Rubrerythrin n=1 Tax=Methanocella arvoryzae (strain DSM 22066 / NBRC 105507 / MRE50) TaxID=351160 RepID=Q0W1D0_METAR|nr:ferritin family protein [Methanocella arvoryzae]CAJ37813.1 rubrerythrin [Methanocella arvoryzae MRE50]
MRDATARCLRDAFCSESMSHVRYLIFAGHAQDEAFPGTSRLFRAFALAKYLRASELYFLSRDMLENPAVNANSYFILERTIDHLIKAKDMEALSVKEVFEPYYAVASSEAESAAMKCLDKSIMISRIIVNTIDPLLQQLKHMDEEPSIGDIYLCSICGFIALDQPPEACPCCNSSAENYILVV